MPIMWSMGLAGRIRMGVRKVSIPYFCLTSLMNRNIRKLHRIASARSRTIIGLMSGTSLDGLDIALVRITGSGKDTRLVVRHFTTISYKEEEKDRVRAVFAKPNISFGALSELNPWVALLHAKL